jgi:hypothetical protein
LAKDNNGKKLNMVAAELAAKLQADGMSEEKAMQEIARALVGAGDRNQRVSRRLIPKREPS